MWQIGDQFKVVEDHQRRVASGRMDEDLALKKGTIVTLIRKITLQGLEVDQEFITETGERFYYCLKSSNMWKKLSPLELLARAAE